MRVPKPVHSWIVSFLILLVVVIHIPGCQRKAEEATPKVRIGMVTFPGYAPLYLAKEKGLFKGVDVELVRIEAISDLRSAMKSGSLDMYCATYDIFSDIEGTEAPGIGFLAIDESQGADGIAAKEEIKSVKDLKGLNVGAEPGFPPYFVLQYLLGKEGLTLRDLNFRDLSSQDAGTAFAAGKLDAAGTYQPYLASCVQNRKGAKVLASSKDVPGLIVDWIFASEKLMERDPDAIKKVATGWFAALDYLGKHEDESYEIMAKAFGVPKQEMIDFKKGIVWHGVQTNKKLFEDGSETNAYKTFDEVGRILKMNKPNTIQMDAHKKLTSKIIDQFK